VLTGAQEIRGLAWSGRRRVAKVEFSVDGGRTWNVAPLQEPIQPKYHTRNGQETVLHARCTDETEYIQPTRQDLVKVRGTNSTYHYNAIQSCKVEHDGRNVYA
jgi:sulfane dehydrogenase subunit SoxC